MVELGVIRQALVELDADASSARLLVHGVLDRAAAGELSAHARELLAAAPTQAPAEDGRVLVLDLSQAELPDDTVLQPLLDVQDEVAAGGRCVALRFSAAQVAIILAAGERRVPTGVSLSRPVPPRSGALA